MKNTVLEKAKNHFLEQINGEMKSVYVKEWDVKIFWKPMNSLQRDRIMAYAFKDEMSSAAVETVILRSLDEDGRRIFADADKSSLMRNVDPKVIDFIFAEMGGIDDDLMPVIDEVKK